MRKNWLDFYAIYRLGFGKYHFHTYWQYALEQLKLGEPWNPVYDYLGDVDLLKNRQNFRFIKPGQQLELF